LLVVFARSNSQAHLAATDPHSRGEEVALARLSAIGGECVDLFLDVPPSKETIAVSTGRIAPNNDRVSNQRRPFALDLQQVVSDVEQQICAAAFANGPVHIDSEGGRRSRNV